MALLLRAGLVVTMTFTFLVVSAPVPVLGGRTRHEGAVTGELNSGVLLRASESGVGLGSPGHIDRGFSGPRKMLLAAPGRPAEATVPGNEAPAEQLDGHASSVDSTAPSAGTSTAPAPPTPFASRFAFLFRSLAKGSSPPSTGTPSPGHN